MPNRSNVIPLRPGRDDGASELPLSCELTEAVGVIGRCLAEIGLEPESVAGFGRVKTAPLLLQMTAVEQSLEKLAEVKVTTWPDVRWALHFCSARIQALRSIRASAASLQALWTYSEPSCVWDQDIVFVNFGTMSRALRGVRDLIVERYPQTSPAC